MVQDERDERAEQDGQPAFLRFLPDEPDEDSLLEGFLEALESLGIEPYAAQEEAFLELFSGKNLILATPTGSGKSLVAESLAFKAMAEGKRLFYTAPIKALVSEKFFDLCRRFGAENVGMMTGDASVHPEAPLIACTAEILANKALREGSEAEVDYVVMDEFHYYSDRERGVAWQIPLLELPRARFLLMSATLGDVEGIALDLEERTGEEVAIVSSATRPVPLEFSYRETPLHETIREYLELDRAPIYIVHFTQRSATEHAQDLMSVDILTKEQKAAVKAAIGRFRFDTPFGKELSRYLHHGVGVHHAGLLPKYRLLVEKLAQAGHLRLICGTDTLGVGVNVPIRTVLFTQLCKFDGEKTRIISVRDFHQIAGRAGRKGFDDRGWVAAQAPAHVIENLELRMKAGNDPKKLRRIKPKKPPERGYVPFDEETFKKLIESDPEKLTSRFNVDHGLVLNMLSRGDEGCRDLRSLIRRSHNSRVVKYRQGRKAIAIIRSLKKAGIVGADDRGLYIDADLQSDFSLNQAASLFVFEASEAFDKDEPDYALDLLTLVEATVEDPSVILFRQLDLEKTRAIQRMKAEGMEYEERMEELEKVERPMPQRETLYALFEAFRERHPWTPEEALRPKSIARQLYEENEDFNGYIRMLGIQRAEGVLLRYLTDVYKGCVQNIPEDAKSDEVYDLTEHLGAIIRQVDSSLIDEWEKLRAGEASSSEVVLEREERERTIVDDPKAFAILVRNQAFRFVRLLARGDLDGAKELLERGDPWATSTKLEDQLSAYYEEYEELRIDAEARAVKNALLETIDASTLRLRQILLDPEDNRDWSLVFRVDLDESREEGRPMLYLESFANDA